jgi:hypothetical protein
MFVCQRWPRSALPPAVRTRLATRLTSPDLPRRRNANLLRNEAFDLRTAFAMLARSKSNGFRILPSQNVQCSPSFYLTSALHPIAGLESILSQVANNDAFRK